MYAPGTDEKGKQGIGRDLWDHLDGVGVCADLGRWVDDGHFHFSSPYARYIPAPL
jgi:hypothetical protein